MTDYKKNLNTNTNLLFSEFDNFFSRINDSAEEKLYSQKRTVWFGYCLSGYNIKTATSNKTLSQFNSPEIVDLGDGIARYKIKVNLFQKITNDTSFSPTAMHSKVTDIEEHSMQARISFEYPVAYTQNISQLPIYGSVLLLVEYGDTMFVEAQVSRTAQEFKATASSSNLKTLFDTPGGPITTKVSNGKTIKGRLNFTWSELKMLAQKGIFEPVLENIRQHECSLSGCAKRNFNGIQYDAYNYSKRYFVGKTSYLPNPLSSYSIAQVTEYWQKKNAIKGGKMFASGAYQIVPKTFRDAIDIIKGLNTADIYNKLNQDALGIYLITMKQPTLGKYMFGDPNIKAGSAGNALAREFASIRLQTSVERDGKIIPAHTKYYGGVGVNKQGKPDPQDAALTMSKINEVRKAIDNDPTMQQLKNTALK